MKSACPATIIKNQNPIHEATFIMATAIVRSSKTHNKKEENLHEKILPLDFIPNRSVHGTPKNNAEIK
jgi:hypothetical protein